MSKAKGKAVDTTIRTRDETKLPDEWIAKYNNFVLKGTGDNSNTAYVTPAQIEDQVSRSGMDKKDYKKMVEKMTFKQYDEYVKNLPSNAPTQIASSIALFSPPAPVRRTDADVQNIITNASEQKYTDDELLNLTEITWSKMDPNEYEALPPNQKQMIIYVMGKKKSDIRAQKLHRTAEVLRKSKEDREKADRAREDERLQALSIQQQQASADQLRIQQQQHDAANAIALSSQNVPSTVSQSNSKEQDLFRLKTLKDYISENKVALTDEQRIEVLAIFKRLLLPALSTTYRGYNYAQLKGLTQEQLIGDNTGINKNITRDQTAEWKAYKEQLFNQVHGESVPAPLDQKEQDDVVVDDTNEQPEPQINDLDPNPEPETANVTDGDDEKEDEEGDIDIDNDHNQDDDYPLDPLQIEKEQRDLNRVRQLNGMDDFDAPGLKQEADLLVRSRMSNTVRSHIETFKRPREASIDNISDATLLGDLSDYLQLFTDRGGLERYKAHKDILVSYIKTIKQGVSPSTKQLDALHLTTPDLEQKAPAKGGFLNSVKGAISATTSGVASVAESVTNAASTYVPSVSTLKNAAGSATEAFKKVTGSTNKPTQDTATAPPQTSTTANSKSVFPSIADEVDIDDDDAPAPSVSLSLTSPIPPSIVSNTPVPPSPSRRQVSVYNPSSTNPMDDIICLFDLGMMLVN